MVVQMVIEDGQTSKKIVSFIRFWSYSYPHKGSHIGHGAVLHGVTVGENCPIGMNAVLMDEAVLEKECIVGALAFVKAKSTFESRSLNRNLVKSNHF